MASASTPSANEPAKDLTLVHTVQLKRMTKSQISGRMISSCISDVAFTSVNSEKTSQKKLMIMIIIIITEKPFTSIEKKEMLGWLNTSLKSTATSDELQLPAILCQDACQLPTSLPQEPSSLLYYLALNSGLGQ